MLDDVFLPAHEHMQLAQETDPAYLDRMALIQSAMAQTQPAPSPVPPAWTDAYDAELRDLIESVSME